MVSLTLYQDTKYSALCPPRDGKLPSLHHPITLPCGHTLSSQHITLPAAPPLVAHSDQPHEIFAAEQRRHQQRLNLWAGVMCPIPSCKRYSPTASASTVDITSVEIDSPSRSISSGAQRGEMSASGVSYYPPPPLAPPAYSPAPPSVETSYSLLDISVDKILHLVKREMDRREAELTQIRGGDTDTDVDTDDEDGMGGRTGLSRDLSDMGHTSTDNPPPSPLTRRMSKRQRNNRRSPAAVVRAQSPDEWPFKKELSSVLECDVCAMMLYEPVTTPCQHVSQLPT